MKSYTLPPPMRMATGPQRGVLLSRAVTFTLAGILTLTHHHARDSGLARHRGWRPCTGQAGLKPGVTQALPTPTTSVPTAVPRQSYSS